MKAFVAGATGQTGRRIVQELVQRQIPVRALTRSLEKGQSILPSAAELVVGDVLKPETLDEAMGDATVLLCATGAAPGFDPTAPYKVDYEGTKNLVDGAKRKGIQHFVFVSSLAASKLFHPLNLFWLILVWKKRAEEYIQSSGLTYTIVRPGGLRNEDNDNPIVMRPADTLFNGSIPRTKVAQVCVDALLKPEAQNKIVEVIAEAEAPARSLSELFADVR